MSTAEFPPSALELEITESTAMRSDASTLAVLRELRQLGVRLSVDDFGTGYSSLGRLQKLPVDAIKVDRSFVHAIAATPGDAGAIAHAVIVMGRSLGLTVTAEGVETEAQAAFVEAHGCDRLQGYLVGKPLPGDAVRESLRARL